MMSPYREPETQPTIRLPFKKRHPWMWEVWMFAVIPIAATTGYSVFTIVGVLLTRLVGWHLVGWENWVLAPVVSVLVLLGLLIGRAWAGEILDD